jgi:hypothetical protein
MTEQRYRPSRRLNTTLRGCQHEDAQDSQSCDRQVAQQRSPHWLSIRATTLSVDEMGPPPYPDEILTCEWDFEHAESFQVLEGIVGV